MLDHVNRFVDALRAIGIPISLPEKVDALHALTLLPLDDRDLVETALVATLVKRGDHLAAFRAVFDIFFARAALTSPMPDDAASGLAASGLDPDGLVASSGELATSPFAMTSAHDLAALLLRALLGSDSMLLRLIAREAVGRYGGFQPGRAVGGTYYVMRTLRALDLTNVQADLDADTLRAWRSGDIDALGARLRNDQFEVDLDFLRKDIEAEVRRLVAADRGADVLARALHKPLPEDLDFMNASANDIDEMRRIMSPLSRQLAWRLQRRRRIGHRGSLDFRRTIRRSMTYGGVPADLRFHPPRPTKPELVVVADISGSVASFARFTLQLLFALSTEFSRVRCFVFVDGLAEVTDLLEESNDLDEVVRRINEQTDVLWIDGRSDYGHAFRTLVEDWGDGLSPRSTVIILGDARNNYHAAAADAMKSLSERVRHVFWLNPEPGSSWNAGDSIIAQYARYCDEVRECRTLGQLQAFVEELA
jgi:uncharacterized protein